MGCHIREIPVQQMMEVFYDVFLPSPWWHPLTYKGKAGIRKGQRVIVPLGKGHRVGIVWEAKAQKFDSERIEIKGIASVVDSVPSIPEELLDSIGKAARFFYCGPGELFKVAFPTQFLKGTAVKEVDFRKDFSKRRSLNFSYIVPDERRMQFYKQTLLQDGLSSIIIFPERRKAEIFWESLEGKLRERGTLWLPGNAKKKWEKWEQIRQGEIKFAVGTGVAVFLPFPNLGRIIVDDESNPVYMNARYPYLHVRTFAGIRSQMAGAELILGGNFPSSRVFKLAEPECHERPDKRLIMVDTKAARKFGVKGVAFPLAISDLILKKTQEVTNKAGATLWILDRLGYANAVVCSECDHKPMCKKCGAPLRWEESKSALICPFCKEAQDKPTICPRCGAPMLIGDKPGAEAALDIAKSLLGSSDKIHFWHGGIERERSSLKKIVSTLKKEGGIVVGSRKALEVCDEIPVQLVCWLDVDIENARPLYDARFRAIKMLWDSLWCGKHAEERTVILQSKQPGRGWQKGLKAGWNIFWKNELQERKDLELPPWIYLLEVNGKPETKTKMLNEAIRLGIEYMDPEPDTGKFWIKAKKEYQLEQLREAWIPFFHVSRSYKGYPKIRVWMD